MNDINNGLAANNLYSNMIKWQAMATVVVVVIALLIGGLHAGASALAGGLSVIVGAFVASKVAKRNEGKTEPTAVLINLLKAEAIKIVIVGVLLFFTFKLYQHLVPFALIAGLAAAALFSGAALAKNKESI